LIVRCSPPRARAVMVVPNRHLPERYGVDAHDVLVMSLGLADLGVNGLLAKDRRIAERADRRKTRRRAKQVQREIDGPVERREAKGKQVEDAVSEAAKEEARRILAEALERVGVEN